MAIPFLSIDDPLNTDAEAYANLARPSHNDKSQAYLYLMGFLVDRSSDPLVAGAKKLQSIRGVEKAYFEGKENFDYPDHVFENALPLPDEEQLCSFSDYECLEYFFLKKSNNLKLLSDHTILLSRYLKLLSFGDYKNLSHSILSEPFPPYKQAVIFGNRLRIVNASIYFQQVDKGRAEKILRDNISHLRRYLSQADDLIGKIIVSGAISESLDALFFLSILDGVSFSELPELNKHELSMLLPFAREFLGVYNTMNKLEGEASFFSTENQAPSWVIRLFFKPNMTINEVYRRDRYVRDISQLNYQKYADRKIDYESEKDNKFSGFKFFFDNLRNSAGVILLSIAEPLYFRYVESIQHLGLKIHLFNQLAKSPSLLENAGSIKNAHMGGHAFHLRESKKICFYEILSKERRVNDTCLNTTH